MNIFNINKIISYPFSERERNVFYKADEFKMRIIDLAENQELPECEMKSYVIFSVFKGKVVVTINNEEKILDEGQMLISEPALFSMKAISEARLIGIQINKNV